MKNPEWKLKQIYEGMIKAHPEIEDMVANHKHNVVDCAVLIGNPGVGNKFASLSEGEQQRLQDIVDSMRIHLAVMEETNLNILSTLEEIKGSISSVKEDAEQSALANKVCINDLKTEIKTLSNTVSSLQTMQKVMWGIISAVLIAVLLQIVGLGFWIVQMIMKTGLPNS